MAAPGRPSPPQEPFFLSTPHPRRRGGRKRRSARMAGTGCRRRRDFVLPATNPRKPSEDARRGVGTHVMCQSRVAPVRAPAQAPVRGALHEPAGRARLGAHLRARHRARSRPGGALRAVEIPGEDPGGRRDAGGVRWARRTPERIKRAVAHADRDRLRHRRRAFRRPAQRHHSRRSARKESTPRPRRARKSTSAPETGPGRRSRGTCSRMRTRGSPRSSRASRTEGPRAFASWGASAPFSVGGAGHAPGAQ